MHIPARILRAHCDEIPGNRPNLSFKEQDRQTRIMDTAQCLMARYGRGALRMTEFARAMRMSPATIHRLFPDMHNLLGQILRRHLQAVVRAMGQVPQDTPNRARAQRAAYLDATRILGAPTEAHLILIRERHLLPPDEREPIEAQRLVIGEILAGDHAEAALSLLDNPELAPSEIEAALAAITIARQPAAPTRQPAPLLAQPGAPARQPVPRHAQCAPNAAKPAPRPLLDPNDAIRPRAGPH